MNDESEDDDVVWYVTFFHFDSFAFVKHANGNSLAARHCCDINDILLILPYSNKINDFRIDKYGMKTTSGGFSSDCSALKNVNISLYNEVVTRHFYTIK